MWTMTAPHPHSNPNPEQVGLTTADIVNASQLTIEGILECAVAMDEAINDFAFDRYIYSSK